mmetsp:Transcript_96538/g.300643  ORF Transcript_96538/g.300643 Transcript_96538/m.300643 type:complete len:235 (+) Transcript_96538:50-754(+)
MKESYRGHCAASEHKNNPHHPHHPHHFAVAAVVIVLLASHASSAHPTGVRRRACLWAICMREARAASRGAEAHDRVEAISGERGLVRVAEVHAHEQVKLHVLAALSDLPVDKVGVLRQPQCAQVIPIHHKLAPLRPVLLPPRRYVGHHVFAGGVGNELQSGIGTFRGAPPRRDTRQQPRLGVVAAAGDGAEESDQLARLAGIHVLLAVPVALLDGHSGVYPGLEPGRRSEVREV